MREKGDGGGRGGGGEKKNEESEGSGRKGDIRAARLC